MADVRRIQLEQWRAARQREKELGVTRASISGSLDLSSSRVSTTTIDAVVTSEVGLQHVAAVASVDSDTASDQVEEQEREQKDGSEQQQQKRSSASFRTPSPLNVVALGGGAIRVPTPSLRAVGDSRTKNWTQVEAGVATRNTVVHETRMETEGNIKANTMIEIETVVVAQESSIDGQDESERSARTLFSSESGKIGAHDPLTLRGFRDDDSKGKDDRAHELKNGKPLRTSGTFGSAPLRVPLKNPAVQKPELRRRSTGEWSTPRTSLEDPSDRPPLPSLQERLDEHRKWDMDDFAVTKNLGKGKFGNVYLAKERHSNVTVALKVLFKHPLLLDGGVRNLQREVEIQSRLQHPHILRLFGYFYDDSCVYLILEHAPQGELFKLLSQQRAFSEAMSAHYIAQVVDALMYLHACHVIHRDIKPENLLVGSNHNIKLADFGWSVHAPEPFSKRRTFCGTPDYLSPEMLVGDDYDYRVDLWSLGVLTFELLFGATPFHVENQLEMYKRIENVDFSFPQEPVISEQAKNFILRLLKRNPNDRMTLEQATQHEWLLQRLSL